MSLQKINVIPNKEYRHAGMPTYASALKKYDFAPTTKGPYQKVERKHRCLKNIYYENKPPKMQLKKIGEDGRRGEVKAQDQQNDSLYICPVQIGTPPQTMNLNFDTGSSDLWLWSTLLSPCTKAADGSKHQKFDPKQSATYKKLKGSSWKIRYGDGSTASGQVGTDNVTLGGLCIEGQAIELADTLSSQFTTSAGDGLLGLAFGTINTVKPKAVKTPVENMIAQTDIPKENSLFTCYLGSWRDTNEVDKGESFYTFGYIDTAVLARCNVTEPHYTPIDTQNGFWQFASSSASINGTTIQRSGNTAIADTGTTLALVSDDLCTAIYAAIPGSTFSAQQQGWIFPIGTPVSALPRISFAVGDKQFEVQREDLGFARVGATMQYGGIQSRGDLPFDILGDTWLKGVYAIFDLGNRRFGVVQRGEGGQNVGLPGGE